MIDQQQQTKLEALYNEKFFSRRACYHWRAPIVAGVINFIWNYKTSNPIKTACDVGCATGDLVEALVNIGIDTIGIEGSKACLPSFVCHSHRISIYDIGVPFGDNFFTESPYQNMQGRRIQVRNVDRKPFDLVTCFEVLEHVEAERADAMVENLCILSDRLLLSACPPNPQGKKPSRYHFNEQPPKYWEEKFAAHGYTRGKKYDILRHKSGLGIPRGCAAQSSAAVYVSSENRTELRFRDMLAPWRWHYGIRAWWENVMYFEKEKPQC
jgi:hypothetical protein